MRTTHRHIQIHNILTEAEARIPTLYRAAANALRINNQAARLHFLRKVWKWEAIAVRATRMLGRPTFSERAETCDSRLDPELERRPANALNVEIGAPAPRCKMRSPDGRGLIWLLSGGSPLAYGRCSAAGCPKKLAKGA